ncbi:MAG: KpsF/GutQ family sugar-phosphate isomerase [Leptospiraceae bacterium]|jgi:arabinose-5-phosphate isomerase|nr:KpsF/GutQ family sugar-phosphate isomerase [Leptospiraceae bacterium]
MDKESIYEFFKTSYNLQIQELQANINNIKKDSLLNAIDIILNCKGKLACSGMGKSGLIAQKLAATFSSLGTPAFFLHPGEALHGDLGVLQKDDVLLVIAKSGESDEVVQMLQVVKKMGNKIISILGNPNSRAGKLSDVIINAFVNREADPLNLAPTSSTTVSLVIGDSLASTIAKVKNFKPENFAFYHPAGQLGKRLLLNVEDLLILDQGEPIISVSATMKELIETITKPNLGGAIVVDNHRKIIGIVTDGDLRRAILKFGNILDRKIEEIMTKNPICVKKGTKAIDALHIMEDRPSQISVLPVVDDEDKPIGLIRIHDLIKAGL